MKLKGKVVLVSGSGRGIGRAAAELLAREGASVIVNDLDTDAAQEVVSAIRSEGGRTSACAGSVTHPDFGTRFVAAALDTFGHLDIIVNNAGYAWDGVIQKMSDEQFEAMLDVHLTEHARVQKRARQIGLLSGRTRRGSENVTSRPRARLFSPAGTSA